MRRATAADLELEQLAGDQFGVFSRAQAVAAAMTVAAMRHRIERGEWRRVAPGVFAFPGHSDSHRRRCWIAILHAGAGAVLSHGAAALLHGLHPVEGDPVELIVPRSRTQVLPGTVLHRPWRPVAHPGSIGGLPVTAPARTIVDLAARLSPARLTYMVEHADLDGVCSVRAVGAELAAARQPGRPGVRNMERVLDRLSAGTDLPRSELEAMGDALIERAGLPAPTHEYPLPSTTGRVGFVDRAWSEARLIVEFDGRRWHTRRHQMHADRQRDLEAAALGWMTQRLVWEMVRNDPDDTARSLAAVYADRVGRR